MLLFLSKFNEYILHDVKMPWKVNNFRICFFCFHKSSGVNTWRDQLKPTQLLQNVARFKGYAPPVFSENGRKINYGGQDYTLDDAGELVHLFYMYVSNSHW